jgi:hypothetical protein
MYTHNYYMYFKVFNFILENNIIHTIQHAQFKFLN